MMQTPKGYKLYRKGCCATCGKKVTPKTGKMFCEEGVCAAYHYKCMDKDASRFEVGIAIPIQVKKKKLSRLS